jgi:hypothetical protein
METDAAHDTGPHPDSAPANAGPKPRKLSEELTELRTRFAERAVTLREVIHVLHGRAYLLLLILLTLPFATPISLPGLSTLFGLVIALISLRLALGQHPWLPERIQDKRLPPGFFGRVFTLAAHVIRFLETFLRPRMSPFVQPPLLRNLHAVLMLVASCVLLLPLPIPLTNTVPAWVILLIAAGLLENDGAFIAGGYAVFVAGVVFFILLGEATHRLFETFRHSLGW